MHWRVKLKKRQQYEASLDVLLAAKQLPPVPGTPSSHCLVAAQLRLAQGMDDDNAVARCKWPLDWLVKRGYVQDDKRKHLRWHSFPEQWVTRKLPPQLTLTLQPVAP